MPTTYSLDEHQEAFVRDQLASGRYDDASAVVRDALNLLEQHEKFYNLRKPQIHAQIAAGMASLRSGAAVDGEAVFGRLDAELASADRS